MPPSTDMLKFSDRLRNSKNIIAIAGAGLSAASGIPTFRGVGGMWRRYEAMSLATPEAFAKDPSLVWQFYHYRREKALTARPNEAHYALAKFSIPAIRETVAPGSTFTLIAQNVDGLSQRALDSIVMSTSDGLDSPQDVGQVRPLEMHGRVLDVVCTSEACGHVEHNLNSPICDALKGTENQVDDGSLDADLPISSLPHCSKCGSLARPGVVWFGELPHHIPLIDNLVRKADLCLVIGTSSMVNPAAGYADRVRRHKGKVAVFNLDHSMDDHKANFRFLGPCEETLPWALGLT